MQRLQNNEAGGVAAGPLLPPQEGQNVLPQTTTAQTTTIAAPQHSNGQALSKKARRKASMLKWRLEKQSELQRKEDSSDFSIEGEEEDFYRLKNNERSKYPWNRPKSNFSTRARWTTLETRLNERWQRERVGLPDLNSDDKEKRKSFVLLDGPPYANGPIHLGHVLNKVLKDAICKYKRMSGYDVEYRVGWDCHGLPIEKLLSGEDQNEGSDELQSTLHLIQKCHEHASKWVNKQKQSFRKLGVLADFDAAYRTDDVAYQAAVVRAFAKFVEGGYVEHNRRPVPWCVSCQTVLAHAEISHLTISDPSCYVFFPLNRMNNDQVFNLFLVEEEEGLSMKARANDISIGFLVWTTSPWSLPFNRGVALNPSLEYCLVVLDPNQHDEDSHDDGKLLLFVVATDCLKDLLNNLAIAKPSCRAYRVGKAIKATALATEIKRVGHPIIEDLQVPIVMHSKVSAKIGTAILHVAPGCCEEDYLLGKENGLEIFCTIDEYGKFTEELNIDGLKGLSVVEGNAWVLNYLAQKGNLILQCGEVEHVSPHCWRCSSPLLFRMTKQWFINLDKNGLFERAQKEIKKPSVSFYPPKSKNPFLTTIACRPHEWCISRQRRWGIPIPAIVCGHCHGGYTSKSFIMKVADLLEAQGGIEFYWQQLVSCRTVAELRERFPIFDETDFTCPTCHHCALTEKLARESCAETTRLETDIFDIWFESGVASFAVRNEADRSASDSSSPPPPPFQMVCEGQDQHRGWYQALLFCSLVLEDRVPSSAFLTHSFVVGQDKKKLSKSTLHENNNNKSEEGHEEKPRTHITFHDTVVGRRPDDFCGDMLRLWACSSKYSTNVIMSDELYRTLRKKYMLLRHTAWFILANLSDFPEEMMTSSLPRDLFPYDKFTLSVLHRLATKVHQAYESYDFATVCSLLLDYTQKDLRPLYLIHAKSRLYFEQADSPLRRSAQYTLWRIAMTISQLWAPILSFLAEQVNDDLASLRKDGLPSIHLQQFHPTEDPLRTAKDKCCWISLEKLRKLVAAEVEAKRKENEFSRNEYAKIFIQLQLPPPPTSSQGAAPAKNGGRNKKKKNNNNKAAADGAGEKEQNFDDDCTNIKSFLEEFATEEERAAFLCSYCNVSQCVIEFVTPPAEKTVPPIEAHEGKAVANQGKRKPSKAQAKKETAAGGGASLKDRAIISATHAEGKLCCRCDFYYHHDPVDGAEYSEDSDILPTTTAAAVRVEVGKQEEKKKQALTLGLCTHCKEQLVPDPYL